jgi:hypothetical protein
LTGFGAVINRHPPTHGKSYFATTNQNFYGKNEKEKPNEFVEKFNISSSQ